MLIAILNQSTLVADADVATMTEAIANQVRLDAAPIWDRAPAAVVFYTDPATVPATAHGIAIVDTIQDQPHGVLGFHTEDQGGQQWGVVAAKPELDNGGQVITGDWSVSSTLSHEVLEMLVDPNCNLWANDDKGSAYSVEVCDPVEAPTYTVNGVSVSNFVRSSASRPTSGPSSPSTRCAPPSTDTTRVARHNRTGSALPFSWCSPASANPTADAVSRCVTSSTSTHPGSETACAREAVFTASPATIPSPTAPNVTATSPVTTPARAASPGTPASAPTSGTAATRSSAARTARSASPSAAIGVPHTAMTASPMNFSTTPP